MNERPSPPRRILALGLVVAAVAIAFLALFRAIGPVSAGWERLSKQGRSVVLVTVDTTRADLLEPYGGEVRTPHLAALAAEGRLFERAFSVAPITLVAHTSLMSGRYPPEHGVRNNGLHAVPAEVETLAEQLAEGGLGHGGHRTAAFVSAAVLEKRYGLDQGFELYDDDLSTGRERHPNMVPDRPAAATVDAARAWLDGLTAEDSFFAWVHLYDPHAPYSPPEPHRSQYAERPHLGEIAYMDSQIGRLLDHPRIDENTVVAVIGDHGESLGEHGERTHAILAYDSTLHVPFLLRAPGVEAGSRTAEPVSQVDLLPTLLGLLGRQAPAGLRGRDLLAEPEVGEDPGARLLYSETYLPHYTYGWAKLEAVRRGALKYIDGPDPELYDLSRDPRELTNLLADQPGAAHDMARDLAELDASFADADRENPLELDAESVEKLRSLGYLAAGDLPERSGPPPDPKAMIELHTGLERARHLARDRLYELAEAELREVLGRDPENLAARLELADALAHQGRGEAAIDEAERALALDPSSVRTRLRLAAFEQVAGRPEQSLALYDSLLEQDPTSLEARLRKAALLVRMGRRAEAVPLVESVVADHPDHPQALVQHALWVDLPAGRRDEAEARLRSAAERDPFHAPAWLRLGELLEGANRGQEAEGAYRSGLEKTPDDADLHARLGQLLARRPSEGSAPKQQAETGAEFHLRQALRLSDRLRSDVLLALGNLYARRGDRASAEAAWGQLAMSAPERPDDLNNRALAFYSLGRLDEARQALEELLEARPGHADGRANLAALAVELGEWELAERQARRLLEQRPESAQAWNTLGVALARTDRRTEAVDAYDRSLELDPGQWRARFNRGLLLVGNEGKGGSESVSGAADDLERALEEGRRSGDLPEGEQAEAHWRLAVAQAGDPDRVDDVRGHLESFLELASDDDPRRPEARSRLESVSGSEGGR